MLNARTTVYLGSGFAAEKDDVWTTIRAASRLSIERRNAAILLGHMARMSITDIAHAARISRRQVSRIIASFTD